MSLNLEYLKRIMMIVLIVCAVICMAPQSQAYDLEVLVGDTSGLSGTPNSVVSVFMRNWTDSVEAFELWLQLSNPDILIFQTNTDTIPVQRFWACNEWDGPDCIHYVEASDYWICDEYVGEDCVDSTLRIGYYECLEFNQDDSCINWAFVEGFDSTSYEIDTVQVGNLDVSGTLIEDWELIESRSLGNDGYDLKITASAETLPVGPPYVPGIGYPQYGLVPLVKIMGDIKNIPDTASMRSVDIRIQASSLIHFSFSDEDGEGIGVVTEEVEDTLWWECQEWADPPTNTICFNYKRVSIGPSDSFSLDTILVGHLDNEAVFLKDGSMTVLTGLCGDANYDNDINLLDILYLISAIYDGGPAPQNPMLADCDCDGLPGANLNLLDILRLIGYIYDDPPGPDPCCEGF